MTRSCLRKTRLILIAVIIVAVCFAFLGKKFAILQAKHYINQKYGEFIVIDNLAVTKAGFIQITSRAWPIFFEYDGIDFQVDILNKNDSFTEKYIEKEYIKRVLSEYQGDNIRLIDIPFVQVYQGNMALDNLFFLEVTFDQTVDNIEEFAYEIEEILLALHCAGLSNCDTLEAFAVIENKTMHIRISPQEMLTSKDILDRIAVFPVSD